VSAILFEVDLFDSANIKKQGQTTGKSVFGLPEKVAEISFNTFHNI